MFKLPVLPTMRCDEGCGECCGPVTCHFDEYDRVVEYAEKNGITPQRQGLTCPFYQDGKCQVYPVRPMLCRLFGHIEAMTCCRGYNANIPRKTEKKIMRAYLRDGAPMRMLHEAIGPGWPAELAALRSA